MRRVGFTIFELLIVVVLLGAAGGLVVTLSAGWLRAAAFREAGRQVEAFLALARAESQRRSEALRVVARRDDDGAIVLVLEPFPQPRVAGVDGRAAADAEGADDSGAREVIDSMTFPSGVTISNTVALVSGEGVSSGEGAVGEGGSPAGGGPDPGPVGAGVPGDEGAPVVIIGVVLPDGQVVPSPESVYLVSGVRAARLMVNGWTGAVEAVEVGASAEDEAEPRDNPRPAHPPSGSPGRGEKE